MPRPWAPAFAGATVCRRVDGFAPRSPIGVGDDGCVGTPILGYPPTPERRRDVRPHSTKARPWQASSQPGRKLR